MSDVDLETIWTVLRGQMDGERWSIAAVPTEVEVSAGRILVGVDGEGRNRLLVPLLAGEAFAEDLSGGAVHLVRTDHDRQHYLSAVCLAHDLDDVFAQFAQELLASLASTRGGAAAVVVSALARWRELFSSGSPGGLSNQRLVGLLAELLTLEEIVSRDSSRRVDRWTGPLGSEHDFIAGTDAIEVKATLAREGRLISISSVDQLEPPAGGSLHLAWYRFEPHPDGVSLPDLVARILDLAVEAEAFLIRLASAGYTLGEATTYESRRYRVVEQRFYDAGPADFPKLTRGSFGAGDVPPGVLRVSYQIDLTNEPPLPLDDAARHAVVERLATAR